MLLHQDPVGPGNTVAFLDQVGEGCDVVASWGHHGYHQGRARAVREGLERELLALRLCANGEPAHPLYLPAITRPRPLRELEREFAAARP